MKKLKSLLLTAFLCACVTVFGQPKPNIIVIVADDLGYNSLSTGLTSYNQESDFFETPAIANLASKGIAFNNAYSNGANCAPTRAALLSGQYPQRITNNIFAVNNLQRNGGTTVLLDAPVQGHPDYGRDDFIKGEAITFGEIAQDSGYVTAHFGKYHVGDVFTETSPDSNGFDYNYGGADKGNPGNYYASFTGSNWEFHANIEPQLDAFADPYTLAQSNDWAGNDTLDGVQKFVTEAITEACYDFLDAEKSNPFLMYVSHYAVHTPTGAVHARPDLLKKYDDKAISNPSSIGHTRASFAAILESMDRNVQDIIDYLYETNDPRWPGHKLYENTIVFFISDNGGSDGTEENGDLSQKKGWYLEGGIRVPMVIWGPRYIDTTASWVEPTPVLGFDIYATVADLVGSPLPSGYTVDAKSLMPIINQSGTYERERLFWHFPGYLIDGSRDQYPVTVLRKGDFKLTYNYETEDFTMYDVVTDRSESNELIGDVCAANPAHLAIASQMATDMNIWLDTTSAPLPTYKTTGDTVPLPILSIDYSCFTNNIDDDKDGITDFEELCGDNATDFSCFTGCTDCDPHGDDDADTVLNYMDPDFCTLNSEGVCASMDADGDGIINSMDLDSDNDGIPDIIEAGGTDTTGDGMVDNFTDTDDDGLVDLYDTTCTSGGSSIIGYADSYLYESGVFSPTGILGDPSTTRATFRTGDTMILDMTDIIPMGSCINIVYDVNENAGTNASTNIRVGTDPNNLTLDTVAAFPGGIVRDTVCLTMPVDTRYLTISRNDNNRLRVFGFYYELVTSTTCPTGNAIAFWDSDGDSYPNHLDLDSDGDGLTDVTEAGGTDADNNGMVDQTADIDGDGWDDSVDGDIGNDNVSENIANVLIVSDADTDTNGIPDTFTDNNTDGEGYHDFLDIDSDDDGIVDNVEGQTTASYTLPGSDTDSDGLNDVYESGTVGSFGGAGISPNDHDGDGTPDYLDGDSDNDGFSDLVEAWDDYADPDSTIEITGCGSADIDLDGLDDCFDANTSSWSSTSYITPGSDNGFNGGNTAASTPTSGDNPDDIFPDNFGIDSEPDWRDTVITIVACDTLLTPGLITGATNPCNGTSESYSINSVDSADSYIWTLPSGWTGSSTDTSINVTVGSSAGNITVKAINDCDTSEISSLSVTVNVTPSTPGAIAGATTPCETASETYSITAVSGATSYTWTLPSGWTGTSTTNSINATVGSASGNITVTANNACGSSSAASLSVTPSNVPATPGAIAGATTPCETASETYSITAVSGATSYTWTLPSGWTGTSTTNSINATVGSASGNITVTANNACGSSSAASLSVTPSNVPATPGAIAGATTPCETASETYSITAVSGATSYTWTLPSGWTGTSTTNSINATVGSASGNITVTANNACGSSSAASLSVTPSNVPATPGAIAGATTPCETASETYSITAVSGATSYTWTLPSGWTGTSTTNSINATVGSAAGNITVTANNACGSSSAASLSVTPSNVPATPGAIAGATTPCETASETYSITAVSGATSYTWTLPSGWTGTSTTNSINATVGSAAGNITVTANNACGSSSAASLSVTPSNVPATPGAIAGATTPCENSAETYSVSIVPGATSYTWTLPSGWTGSSTTNTINALVGTTGGNITVTANNACGSSTASSLTTTISLKPSADWSATNNKKKVTFTDLSSNNPTGWSWDFGNGNSSTSQNPMHTYASYGTYTVCLIATNVCGSDTSCKTFNLKRRRIRWTGAVSNLWNDPMNWSDSVGPTSCADTVEIPDVTWTTGNSPILASGDTGFVNYMIIEPNAEIELKDGGVLDICGNIEANGNPYFGMGKIVLSGSTPQTILGDIKINHLILNNPNGVTQTSGTVTVDSLLELTTGVWSTNGNKLLLSSSSKDKSGQISKDGSGSIIGNLSVQRYVPKSYTGNQDTGAYETGYHYVSSPVNNATIADMGDEWWWSPKGGYPAFNLVDYTAGTYYNFGTFYEYDEAAPAGAAPYGPPYNYERWVAPTTTNAIPGKGYAAHLQQDVTIEVSGDYTHVNSPVINLTKTGTTNFDGWNLIGNPFPSGYDWTTAVRNNVDAAIYWWDPDNLQYVSSIGGGSGSSPLANNIGAVQAGASPNANIIQPMQGFMVVANGPAASVTFDRVGRTISDGVFYKDATPQFVLKVETPKGYADELTIYSNKAASDNYDGEFDAYKFKSSNTYVPTLFSKSTDGKDLSINGINLNGNDKIVALGVSAKHTGTYSFKSLDVKNIDPSQMIYLEDKVMGTFTNIRTNGYSFNWNKGDAEEGRFFIHIYQPVKAVTADATCNGNDGIIHLDQQGSMIWDKVQVVNSSGLNVGGGNTFSGTLTIDQLAPDTYQVELLKNGSVVTLTLDVNGKIATNASIFVDATQKQEGELFSFEDASTNTINNVWDMGDGIYYFDEELLDHAYADAGVYTVKLTSITNDCSSDQEIVVNVLKVSTGFEDEKIGNTVSIYGYNNAIYVNSDIEIESVIVYDYLGKEIANRQSEFNKQMKIDLNEKSASYYIVKVKVDGEILTHKVLVSN